MQTTQTVRERSRNIIRRAQVRDLRSLLAELRSQRLDEGHQNLSLDSDLFKHRDVHISFLGLPLA